jgi:hypothetical protein
MQPTDKPWAKMQGGESYPAALWIACVGALLGSLSYGYSIGVLNTR